MNISRRYMTRIAEYVDGELLERNVGEFDHSGIQGIIFAHLYSQRREYGIHVFPELRVQVAGRKNSAFPFARCYGSPRNNLCFDAAGPVLRLPRLRRQTRLDHRSAREKGWPYTREGKREPAEVLTTSDPRLTLSLNEIFAELSESVEE